MTSADIVNQALQLIGGNQPPVTGTSPTFDDSAAGKAASYLYVPTVQTVARQFGWDFARKTVALTLTGNTAPYPWAYEYGYPAQAVEVWSLMPSDEADANDPLPYNFNVANAVVSGQQTRVIHTNLATPLAVYNNAPNENAWDASFREAVVRLLASNLAMAIAGKPDVAEGHLKAYGAFQQIGEGRQD